MTDDLKMRMLLARAEGMLEGMQQTLATHGLWRLTCADSLLRDIRAFNENKKEAA